jgi:hypothetical protein
VNERTLALNTAERERLESLTARLSDDDLVRVLPNGWTVAVALAHLAFWESLDAELLTGWQKGLVPPVEPDWYADTYNEALLPLWQALPPRDAVRLAVDAMSRCDAAVASLDDALVGQIRARGEMWLVRRYLHRREHLGQIEAELSRR